MPEPVGKLNVTFRALEGSGVTPAKDIALSFRGSDGRLYQIDIAASCAAIAISALARHSGEIDSDNVQPILVTSVQGRRFEDGSPLLFLGVEGGGQLSMKLEHGDLNELIVLLQNIASPSAEPRH